MLVTRQSMGRDHAQVTVRASEALILDSGPELKTNSPFSKGTGASSAELFLAVVNSDLAATQFPQHCVSFRNLLTLIQRHQQSGQEKACHAELVNRATSNKVESGG